MKIKIRVLTKLALLAALITVTGAIKLPSFAAGAEFQLSAPLAVAICAVYGFTSYITAGILSSLIGLILGLQNLLNISIAMIFRLTIGGLLLLCGTSRPMLIIAGPIGSALARLSLGLWIGRAVIPLLAAALPGMLFTAAAAVPLTRLLQRVEIQTEKVIHYAVQR
ncbi:MAG: hypothetical protein ABFC57_01765 [Veillonellales bacterium]